MDALDTVGPVPAAVPEAAPAPKLEVPVAVAEGANPRLTLILAVPVAAAVGEAGVPLLSSPV